MNSRIGKIEWIVIFTAAITVDVVQIILDVFAVGVIINRIISIAFGAILNLYFLLRGVKMGNSKIIMAIITSIIGEVIPVVDALPLWTREVFVVWSTTNAEKVIAKVPVVGGAAITAINKAGAAYQPSGTAAKSAANTGTRILGEGIKKPGPDIVDGIRRAA